MTIYVEWGDGVLIIFMLLVVYALGYSDGCRQREGKDYRK